MWWLILIPLVYSHYVCSYNSIPPVYYTDNSNDTQWPTWRKVSDQSICTPSCQPCVTYGSLRVGYKAQCHLTPDQQMWLGMTNHSILPMLSENQLSALPTQTGVYKADEHHAFIHYRILCITETHTKHAFIPNIYTNPYPKHTKHTTPSVISPTKSNSPTHAQLKSSQNTIQPQLVISPTQAHAQDTYSVSNKTAVLIHTQFIYESVLLYACLVLVCIIAILVSILVCTTRKYKTQHSISNMNY